MAIVTIWALFSDDLRTAAAPKSADDAFIGIISLAFFLFILEILAASFCKDDYLVIPDQEMRKGETALQHFIRRSKFGSFYFWSDVIATLSLIFEIPWTGADLGADDLNRAGDPANTGARASKTIRLVRMVRLVRLVKLYKYSAKIQEKEVDQEEDKLVALDDQGEEEVVNVGKESRVGAAMTDLTNRRVIIMILIMLILIPLLTVVDTNNEPEVAVSFIHAIAYKALTNPSLGVSRDLAIDFTKKNLDVIYLDLSYKGESLQQSFTDAAQVDALRVSEMSKFYTESSDSSFRTTLWVDNRTQKVNESTMAIYTTLFVIVVLIISSFMFSSDVTRLVITPIERMVELVSKISANPLGVEYKMLGAADGFVDGMETTALLATITKIGRLMKVGFGEAGASVIASSMSHGTEVNLLGGGHMIHSIFGFCDVRQFTDTTECLQEEVMLFVNRIGHILHSIVVQCSGAANKNIGDAFLLTWKLEERWEFIINFSSASTARLYKRFPGYHVRIGSGLHVGWAVEGAIGSHRKIDASYLSPHVNFTEFLESSTKAYGTPLLISENFFKLLSPAAAKFIRQVDRIRPAPSEEPLGLYTYDTARMAMSPEEIAEEAEKKRAKAEAEKAKKAEESKRLETPTIVMKEYHEDCWRGDPDLVDLRHRVNEKYRSTFHVGIQAYIEGDWEKAKETFEHTKKLSLQTGAADGPSCFLLNFMEETNFVPPGDWDGYRKDY
eukprot:GSChrysophyteH2.ASY1.ANO1.1063.1 assembled CDS